jgi:hypothetical protein
LNRDFLKDLAELEKGMGIETFSDLPEGFYHFNITSHGISASENYGPRLRVEHNVLCGPSEGRKYSNFFGWFASTEDKTNTTRGIFRSMLLDGLNRAVGGADMEEVYRGYKGLLVATGTAGGDPDHEIVTEHLEVIGEAVKGLQPYGSVYFTKDKVTGEYRDRPNMKYLKSDSQDASCECSRRAIAV